MWYRTDTSLQKKKKKGQLYSTNLQNIIPGMSHYNLVINRFLCMCPLLSGSFFFWISKWFTSLPFYNLLKYHIQSEHYLVPLFKIAHTLPSTLVLLNFSPYYLFVNKILLEHSQVYLLIYRLWLFCLCSERCV